MTESRVGRIVADRRLLFGVTFAAAMLAFVGPLMAYDLWWHLKAARLIVESLSVPRTDPFSFTAAGRPWVYHSWLSGLTLLGVWETAGAGGVILMRALLIALSLMIAWAAARQRGVSAGLASVLVLAACLQMEVRALARPYLFSFLMFVVFVVVLEGAGPAARQGADAGSPKARRRRLGPEWGFLWGPRGRLILLPLLTVLWANMHAGFISGLLLLGAYGVGEMARLATLRRGRPYLDMVLRDAEGARFRAMVVAGALCLAASVVTPYGWGVLLYPFRLTFGVKLVKQIQEWQPTPLGARFVVFWSLLALGVLILLRSLALSAGSGRLRREAGRFVTDALLLGGFAFLAVGAVRHMAWFLLLAPAILGYHVEAGRSDAGTGRQEKAIYAYAVVVLALVIGVWPFVSSGPPELGVSERHTPVKACDYMEANGLGYTLYNSYEWGGYLTWRFWPALKVFIDGRCLVYRDDIIGQVLTVERGEEGWEQVLDRWDVEMFLVRYRKKDSAHLFAGGRWRCVYWDDVAVIGLREDVLAGRASQLPEFALSNPVAFEQSLERQPPGQVLTEVDAVLARDPECWTALGFRARCLVRLAGERTADAGRRRELLDAALASARRALDVRECYETWLAVSEAASALGRQKLARQAAEKVHELRPKDVPRP